METKEKAAFVAMTRAAMFYSHSSQNGAEYPRNLAMSAAIYTFAVEN